MLTGLDAGQHGPLMTSLVMPAPSTSEHPHPACTADDDCSNPVVARGLCRKHYLREWRAHTLTRNASAPKKPRRCPVGDGHNHSVDGCWKEHGCRCVACTHSRKMERQRRRVRLRAYGREDQIGPRRVDAAPARAALTRLIDAGIALDRIAVAMGISRSNLATLRYGYRGAKAGIHQQTVNEAIATALIALDADSVATAIVPGLGSTRRLQALVAIGHTQLELAAALGRDVGNLSGLVLGHQQRITTSTRAAVTALFDTMWDQYHTGAGADRARRVAERRGWLPPMAWDDIDTDSTPPDLATSQSRGERILEDVEWLLEAGESLPVILSTVDSTADAVSKLAYRYERPDLARHFIRRNAA